MVYTAHNLQYMQKGKDIRAVFGDKLLPKFILFSQILNPKSEWTYPARIICLGMPIHGYIDTSPSFPYKVNKVPGYMIAKYGGKDTQENLDIQHW